MLLITINRYISWVTNHVIYFRLENDIINIYNDTDIRFNYDSSSRIMQDIEIHN